MVYNRLPGPWKRYAHAAGGHADAGGLLDHILLRFRTDEALRPLDGAFWIAQSVRCWLQEVPLSERRFTRALRRLEQARMVEVRLARISDASPTRFTHIRLTADGEKFLKSDKRKGAHADRKRRLPHSVSAGSSAVMEPVHSTECQNRLFTESSERRPSEISLAPNGARDRQTRKARTKKAKKETDQEEELDVGTARDVEAVWIAALREHVPEQRCSPFDGPKWHFARRVAGGLGPDLERVIDAVVRDWSSFRAYLANHRGAVKRSVVPDIACLASHVDAAYDFCRWQEEQRLEDERTKMDLQEAQARRRREQLEREREASDQRRDEYARLAKSAGTVRANLEDAVWQLEQARTEPGVTNRDRQRNERSAKEYIGERERDLARLAELEAEFGQPTSLTIEDEPCSGSLLGPQDYE